jgi:CBS domain-containing protein
VKVRDVMTPAPVMVDPLAPVEQVARVMRDQDLGMVLVADTEQVFGLVTDRDLVVRGLASGVDVRRADITTLCSAQLIAIDADEDAEAAGELMRTHAVRRLPVVQDGAAVGVVTLGDLAASLEPGSALGEISSAPPSR